MARRATHAGRFSWKRSDRRSLYKQGMLSVVIPTFESERVLPRCLASLVAPMVEGFVREVIIVDGGSADATARIAEDTGARLMQAAPQRSAQIRMGAEAARFQWLLILPPETALDPGWADEAAAFVLAVGERTPLADRAGIFRYAIAAYDGGARWRERAAVLNGLVFGLPRSEQGLLIAKQFYDRLSPNWNGSAQTCDALFKAIGRRRLVRLRTAAVVGC